jgi:hypothetical protein
MTEFETEALAILRSMDATLISLKEMIEAAVNREKRKEDNKRKAMGPFFGSPDSAKK